MKQFVKAYWKTIVFFTLVGLVGGFFVGIYLLDSYPQEIRQLLMAELETMGLAQFPVNVFLGVVTGLQSAGYGLVLGTIGILLSKAVGLWKDERAITGKPLAITLAVAVVGGLAMILPDLFFFGHYAPGIQASYAVKPTIAYMLAMVTYGAVIEEVMLRLFAMSLIAFILHRIFDKEKGKPALWVLATANVMAALLFAAGHLPVTLMTLGSSPMILFRCFLLNGGFGLLFGALYRRYGLRYAMLAHGGCHIVSKLIWILFI